MRRIEASSSAEAKKEGRHGAMLVKVVPFALGHRPRLGLEHRVDASKTGPHTLDWKTCNTKFKHKPNP